MLPYQERVVDEQRNLQTKIIALQAFLEDEERIREIDPGEHADLVLQLGIMHNYNGILDNRILRFKGKPRT